jgi:hypothetical protein
MITAHYVLSILILGIVEYCMQTLDRQACLAIVCSIYVSCISAENLTFLQLVVFVQSDESGLYAL